MTAMPPIRPNDDEQAKWVLDWLKKSRSRLSIAWRREYGLGDVFGLMFGDANPDNPPAEGVWMAYNDSGFGPAVPFQSELEALRYALEYAGVQVRLVPWGADANNPSTDKDVADA